MASSLDPEEMVHKPSHLDLHCLQRYRNLSQISITMANSVDPDEMACYELSYLDLHCLQRYSYWFAGLGWSLMAQSTLLRSC